MNTDALPQTLLDYLSCTRGEYYRLLKESDPSVELIDIIYNTTSILIREHFNISREPPILVQISSLSGNTETLFFGDRCYIIFDSSLVRQFSALTAILLRQLRGDPHKASDAAAMLLCIKSDRLLREGRLDEAIDCAFAHCLAPKYNQEDIDPLFVWCQIGCALAHEICHYLYAHDESFRLSASQLTSHLLHLYAEHENAGATEDVQKLVDIVAEITDIDLSMPSVDTAWKDQDLREELICDFAGGIYAKKACELLGLSRKPLHLLSANIVIRHLQLFKSLTMKITQDSGHFYASTRIRSKFYDRFTISGPILVGDDPAIDSQGLGTSNHDIVEKLVNHVTYNYNRALVDRLTDGSMHSLQQNLRKSEPYRILYEMVMNSTDPLLSLQKLISTLSE